MPFSVPLLEEIYRGYVKPTIEALGVRCLRGDDIFSTSSIMEDIWSSLCRCSFVVGEFTGRNPNVLYEAGIAHTLGKPLIGITQVVDDIPFDFRHVRVINYANSPMGYAQLQNRLTGTVKTLLEGRQPLTPRSLAELEQRVDYLIRLLTEERSRTQQLYRQIEFRHRQQIEHFHAQMESGRPRADEFSSVELCEVSAAVVSVDEWDDEQDAIVRGEEVAVGGFSIGKYPITNAQYAEFVTATGHYPPEHWGALRPPGVLAKNPVVGVSWNDAQIYCAWLGERLGAEVRLPSEAEWLVAAGYGDHGRRYPWGEEWIPDACNSSEYGANRHLPVDRFEPTGVAASGCADMLGNVWEWTSSDFDSGDGFPWRAVRGGASYTPLMRAGSLARLIAYPGHFLFVRDLGLRVVVR